MSVFDDRKKNGTSGEALSMTMALTFPDKEFPGEPTKDEILLARSSGLKSAYELVEYDRLRQRAAAPPPPPPPPTNGYKWGSKDNKTLLT
ncbi:hypothetical protein [Methylotuvimicrobium sp. KM1]|uniref:hypothetical protein n=1 Tax=Methylotuvimicrobium sp. KM1 TaxID=3377707 RepID=UPI00384C3F5B